MDEQNINTESENVQTEEKKEHKPFKRYIAIGVGAIVAIVQVAPRVSGQITEVYITDNQKVKEGDLVAKIDPADYEIALAQADAKYEKTLLNQKNAKANFKAI